MLLVVSIFVVVVVDDVVKMSLVVLMSLKCC